MAAFDLNDPRTQQAIGVVVQGLADIFRKCSEIFSGSARPAPEKVAIRKENLIVDGDYAKVSKTAAELPPDLPDPSKPIDSSRLHIPTWAQLLNLYNECAIEMRTKNGYPNEKSVRQVTNGIRKNCEMLGIGLDEPYTTVTRQRIRTLEDIGLKAKKSRTTIQAWRTYFKQITARWAVLMYEERGWDVKSIVTEPFNTMFESVKYLPKEHVEKIDAWIAELKRNSVKSALDRNRFLFVYIMRNLACRNGDVFDLTWGNFERVAGGMVRFAYIPHKTSRTSRRKAAWKLSAEKFADIEPFEKSPDVPIIRMRQEDRDEFQRELNRQIKALLPPDRNKGLYELRKLSAQEAYKAGGVEAVMQKTGDSWETLNTNYTDTSADGDDSWYR